jgi:3-hydroxyisobutyrate dehydrogenase-like beta-hydroxyacid dehydrogenase
LLACCATPTTSEALGQPLPVAAAANEQFKKAQDQLGLGDADFAAVFEAVVPPAEDQK